MIDITPNQNKGVLKVIGNEGEGDEFPLPGSMVKINYFVAGIIRDSRLSISISKELTYEFLIGRDTAIMAWDIGIPTMKKDEQAVFICDPAYAVKKNHRLSSNIINISYSIRLMSWKGQDLSPNLDEGVTRYHTLVLGKDHAELEHDDIVEVHLVGQYEKTIFDERDVEFIISEGSESNVIEGIVIALLHFYKGETSKIKIKPKYAFGTEGCVEWGVPPNATVDYNVALKSVNKYNDFSSQSTEQRMQRAQLYTEAATRYFQKRKYNLAKDYFQKVETFLKSDKDLKDDLSEKRIVLLLTAYWNIGEISLKVKKYERAKDAASQALAIDPNNLKALIQRGKAFMHLCKSELAKKDFERCLEIDPTNVEMQHALRTYPRQTKNKKS